jgi:hypothetical protein
MFAVNACITLSLKRGDVKVSKRVRDVSSSGNDTPLKNPSSFLLRVICVICGRRRGLTGVFLEE